MPCTAKKAEAIRPNSFTEGEQDTDIVITTMELLRMIDNFGLDFASLDPEACDMPFGFGSGGGVIFGVTGGVTEAVLRRLTPDHTKEAMREISECGVRGEEGIKEFSVPYKDMEIKVCVASGLANARIVMDRVKNGEAEYHLIEVMACRRGCIMGGGQPTRSGDRTKAARARVCTMQTTPRSSRNLTRTRWYSNFTRDFSRVKSTNCSITNSINSARITSEGEVRRKR